MRRAPSTALVMLWLALGAGVAVADDRALLIGIGSYRIEQANLPGVEEDLAMMREVAGTLGFADRQIKVLADSEATLQGIRNAIEQWLVGGTSAGDRALYYHSGHGSRVPDASGDETDGSDEALLPFDFVEVAAGGDKKELRHILLDDELGRLLARIPAREVVALVDSCHSGTMTRSLDGEWTSKFYSYPGMPRGQQGSWVDLASGSRSFRHRESIVLLSAAGPAEDAQTSKRGALFTQGVWRAVREAEPRQQLTLEQLKSTTERYIRQEVGSRTELAHRPMLTGGEGLRSINLFLPLDGAEAAATPRPGTPAAGTPAAGTPAAGSDLWHQLEALVQGAGQVLEVTASKALYRAGESLELSVIAPSDGYLHILNVGEREDQLIVLYPNRYQTDNRVLRGQTVHIPSAAFNLPANLPSDLRRQKNLVVAIQTSTPLFPGRAPAPADSAELFRVIRRGELTRSISRQPPAAYSAGQVVVTIGL